MTEVDCADDPGSDAALLQELVIPRLDVAAAETWLEEVYDDAIRVLREHWSDVERVAAALIDRRQLDRDDLWSLLLRPRTTGPEQDSEDSQKTPNPGKSESSPVTAS